MVKQVAMDSDTGSEFAHVDFRRFRSLCLCDSCFLRSGCFVAMGGNADKSGKIRAEARETVRKFQLTMISRYDVVLSAYRSCFLSSHLFAKQLIHETDTDNSGFIDFDEFSAMLNG